MKAKWSECRFRFVPESSGLGVINVQSLSCCRYTCVLRMLVGGRLGGKRGTWAGMGAAHLQTDPCNLSGGPGGPRMSPPGTLRAAIIQLGC